IASLGVALLVLAALPATWKRLSAILLETEKPGRIGRARRAIHQLVCQLADSLAAVRHRGLSGFAAATGWALAGHASVTTGVLLALWSLGSPTHVTGVLFTYSMTTAGAVALFALPGSQVGWDLLFGTLLWATAGVSETDAAAITLVVRAQQMGLLLLGAAAMTWLLRQQATNHDKPLPADPNME
ncbi:MAG: hypothetical protein QF464_15375, partial [Myxococcota bacterium]|nr:hypothetical protein [Myxococcota bacterium]